MQNMFIALPILLTTALLSLPTLATAVLEVKTSIASNVKTGNTKTVTPVDRLVYEPIRFLALEKLWILGSSSFGCLRDSIKREVTDLTDGNLASHLIRLEKARYIKVQRRFRGRKPEAVYTITERGKEAFEWFLISFLNRLYEASSATGITWSPPTKLHYPIALAKSTTTGLKTPT